VINLKNYIKNKKILTKRYYLAAGVFLFGVVVYFILLPRTEYGVKRFYLKQLSKLEVSVNNISKDISSTNDTRISVDSYLKKLSEPMAICKKVKSRYGLSQKGSIDKPIRDAVKGAKTLCDDLSPILAYSTELYITLTPYLIYDTNVWPAFENEEFVTRLAETQGMIRTTLPRLEKINFPDVEDPALGEIITQVKSAEKLADDSYAATTKNDSSSAQGLTEHLRKDLRQDKVDFLSARQYFWQNTVQIDSLQGAIKKLQDQLKS
jgi:hypothetical protein